MKLSGKQRAVFCFEVVTIVAAVVLVATGSWIHSAGAEWLVFTGIALFLLAGVPVLRALAGPWTTEDLLFDRKSSTKRISHGIVALSSAAILSVYAARRYHRTSSAAGRFEAQSALERHRNAAIAAAVALPSARPAQPPAAEASRPIAIASAKPLPAKTASSPIAGTNALPEENVAAETPAPAEPAAPRAELPVNVAAIAVPVQVLQPVAPVQIPESPQSKYMDGTYFAWGSCRHGTLQVKLVIETGRIASADIEQCRTRYSCSVIKSAPPQLVSRQTPEAIDNVSGATQSVDAYYYAVSDALRQATRSEK